MTLNRIDFYSFRNYAELHCEFDPGVNLIVGSNAQGKTNLLEGIGYLSTGKAFRTRKEQELIRFGADFCDISGEIALEERVQTVRAVMFRGKRQRQLYIGGVKQKSAAGLSGLMRTVLFCPEDLTVLKGGSAGRRKLLDDALCQLRPGYDAALTEYKRILENKSRILKDYREIPSMLDTLPEFNEQLARCGAVLISTRAKYIRELEKQAAFYHSDFSGGKEIPSLRYDTVSNIEDPFVSRQELYSLLREHQESHYRAELESGQCLSGPHKDDFCLSLNGLPVQQYGSQGQTRTAAISLKLAEREIFRQDTGREPVLLLDDVLSELDEGRQNFILNRIRTGQVFITCCEKDRITEIGRVFSVEEGCLRAAEG